MTGHFGGLAVLDGSAPGGGTSGRLRLSETAEELNRRLEQMPQFARRALSPSGVMPVASAAASPPDASPRCLLSGAGRGQLDGAPSPSTAARLIRPRAVSALTMVVTVSGRM